MHEQLSDHFVTNNLISSQQYEFRKISSTEHVALELIDKLNSQKIPINLYIDQTYVTFVIQYELGKQVFRRTYLLMII